MDITDCKGGVVSQAVAFTACLGYSFLILRQTGTGTENITLIKKLFVVQNLKIVVDNIYDDVLLMTI